MRLFWLLLAAAIALPAQRPVIAPGGVVNAASYATGGTTGKSVSQGSLVAIFGSNLAGSEQSATGFPLPTELGGTSVTLNGARVPLLYVSPHQINVQFSPVSTPIPRLSTDPASLVVATASGASEPVLVLPGDYGPPFGVFTLDGSGCGRGAVLNVAADGSLSLNSPTNSASPGDFLTVYGTGLVGFLNAPPAGSPAPFIPRH
jgi:uncharacterized protein (TIGR03437 family)